MTHYINGWLLRILCILYYGSSEALEDFVIKLTNPVVCKSEGLSEILLLAYSYLLLFFLWYVNYKNGWKSSWKFDLAIKQNIVFIMYVFVLKNSCWC